MTTVFRSARWFALPIVFFLMERVVAEEPAAPGAAAPPSSTGPAETVRFGQRATGVGDRVAQDLAVGLDLTTKFTQSGQTAHEGDTVMRRQQQRLIEVLEVADGRPSRARVAFPLSRLQTPDGGDPTKLQPQAIEGKTYLVARRGDRLLVTDLQGGLPPLEEYRVAAEALETLGRPNLLAKFLLEKAAVRVGERLLVPRAVAKSLMGMSDEIGAIKRFELQLTGVEGPAVEGGSPRAVFEAKIETMANQVSPIEMVVTGQVKIETETSRTVAAELNGPIRMNSVQQTSEGVYQFDASGSLRVAIRSQYGVTR